MSYPVPQGPTGARPAPSSPAPHSCSPDQPAAPNPCFRLHASDAHEAGRGKDKVGSWGGGAESRLPHGPGQCGDSVLPRSGRPRGLRGGGGMRAHRTGTESAAFQRPGRDPSLRLPPPRAPSRADCATFHPVPSPLSLPRAPHRWGPSPRPPPPPTAGALCGAVPALLPGNVLSPGSYLRSAKEQTGGKAGLRPGAWRLLGGGGQAGCPPVTTSASGAWAGVGVGGGSRPSAIRSPLPGELPRALICKSGCWGGPDAVLALWEHGGGGGGRTWRGLTVSTTFQ